MRTPADPADDSQQRARRRDLKRHVRREVAGRAVSARFSAPQHADHSGLRAIHSRINIGADRHRLSLRRPRARVGGKAEEIASSVLDVDPLLNWTENDSAQVPGAAPKEGPHQPTQATASLR